MVSRTSVSNVTVAAESERSQSFTIYAPADASSEDECMVHFTANSEGDIDQEKQSTNAKISVANLRIDEGGVEPSNANAKANANGHLGIPISNKGFLAADVIVYLEADELGDTVYPQQTDSIVVPANGTAFAVFNYSDSPPGDARLEVTLEVINTPTHEESDESAIITIKFSNMADEDGESDWLVVVIIALTGLVLYGGYKTAKKGSSGRRYLIWILSPLRRQNLGWFRHIFKPYERQQCCSMWDESELGNVEFIPEPSDYRIVSAADSATIGHQEAWRSEVLGWAPTPVPVVSRPRRTGQRIVNAGFFCSWF